LSQALTAFGRAVRAHRRLARLAPAFFDSAVHDREAENRAETRRWMATWEPALARVYGVDPQPPDETGFLPPLPSPQIQREIELELAERQMCLAAGHAALERYRQRQPHALMSWHRMARLLQIGFDLGRLACGLDRLNPLPDKVVYDYELTALKRSYPPDPDPPPVPASAAAPEPVSVAAADPCGQPGNANATSAPAMPAPPPRSDAWRRWSRMLRRS
jgi:hypothetical protein